MSKDLSTISCPHGKGFKCPVCWPVTTPVDVYRVVAGRAYGIPTKDVTLEQRGGAKSAMYMYLYGGDPDGGRK